MAAVSAIVTADISLADELSYENTRLTVPAHKIRAIDPPPANGDGIRFVSENGATLSVFGQFNVFDEIVAQMRQRLAGCRIEDGQSVTCEVAGNDWPVLFGFSGDDIHYKRHEFGRDMTIHGAVLVHPAAEKARFRGLVESFARRLSGP